MCLIEKFTDVYPMEIRTRKITHRCLFSDGRDTCYRTRVHDRGEFYHARRVEPKDPPSMTSPRYHTIAPVEATRPREPRDSNRPFGFSIPPFIKRASEPDASRNAPRGRGKSHRPFVVESPDINIEYRCPRRPTSASRTRSASPRTRVAPLPESQKQPYSPGFPPPDNQTQHTPQEPRRPRERTPVAERVPLRRRQSSPPRRVEVHNDRPEHRSSLSSSRGNGLTKKAEGRQVHFSSDIEYVDDTEQSETGLDNGQKRLHPHREQSRRINPFTKHKQENFEDEASFRLKSRGRTSSFRVRPALAERIRGPPRAYATIDTRYDRPRIIQDGRRQISEAGERIYEEARQRQSRDDFRRDFPSQASHRRQSRRSDRFQSFNSGDERIVYDKGPRRHGWRWP